MREVASRAGVSHQTVSRVINESPQVSESTRSRVLSAIAELGYRPNTLARSLARGRSQRIGVLVENTLKYGPMSTLNGIETAARDAGHATTTYSMGPDEDMAAGVEFLMGQQIDGLAIITPRQKALAALRGSPLPPTTVLVSSGARAGELLGVPTVQSDQTHGARAAMDHLLQQGHRRIAHLAGPADWFDARRRHDAWRTSLTEHGLAADLLVQGDWEADSGYAAAGPLLQMPDATAVFVANDQMALGLMHGLARHGRSVPDDISVVGFDDVPESAHYLPPLTTVHQDFGSLGRAAVRTLLGAGAAQGADEADALRPWLVVRETSRPPRP